MTTHRPDASGFTLLEIIVVMTLLAILSVAFVGRFSGGNAALVGGVASLKSHLRFAQSKAMSTGKNWYVRFGSGSPVADYALYQQGDGAPKVFPGSSGALVELEAGIGATANAVVAFDRLGRPFTDAACSAAQNGVRMVATSAAGSIEIRPQTGYIP